MKALEAYVKSLSDRRAELDKLESQVDDREVAVEKGPEAKAFLSLVDKEVARIHEIKDDAVKQKEINALLAIAHQQDNVTYQLKKVRVWIDDGRNGASSYVKKQLK
jgi:hypothetical protein